MTIWFTADHHFGHANIIKHCNRPFSSVEEMDAVLIERWNSRVAPNDIVYHLGDFTWRGLGPQYYLDQLNGRIHLIIGNHDNSVSFGAYASVRDYDFVKYDGHKIVLCHYPFESWNHMKHGSIHLHGHCHGNLGSQRNRLDVGVDCHDFYPLNFDQVLAKINEGIYAL